jgi:hypothetical protein
MTIAEVTTAINALKPHSYSAAQIIAWLSELDTSVYWQLVRTVNPYDEFEEYDENGDPVVYNTNDIISFDNRPYVCLADGVDENPDDAPTSWAEETWAGYTDSTAETTTLLAPVPYDRPLYIHWLCMQINLYNRELIQYNNEAALYTMAWDALANHLNRTFPPCALATHFGL